MLGLRLFIMEPNEPSVLENSLLEFGVSFSASCPDPGIPPPLHNSCSDGGIMDWEWPVHASDPARELGGSLSLPRPCPSFDITH